ncbi:MAG: D-alanine--D-alanine ligase [Oligoflexales bacterium]
MQKKIRLAIIFGGQSAEHEISILSARSIFQALDRNKYEPVLVGIGKTGKWYLGENSTFLLQDSNPKHARLQDTQNELCLVPGKPHEPLLVPKASLAKEIDVAFPVLHGPLGEDGTVQGMLKLAGIPFVGVSVLGSAVCMDKDVTKRLLAEAGLPVCRYLMFRKSDQQKIRYNDIETKLGSPFFVKPCNLGSSVGVSKVRNAQEFDKAIADAFKYDRKIIIEEFVKGRELEVSVLGNENPETSDVGEIIPSHDFYSYESKYIDEKGAALVIPAKISDAQKQEIKSLAAKAFTVLECEGMARCDFFMTESGKLYINELNTIPGFTKISMYAKLWESAGLPYENLIDKLVQLALKRDAEEKQTRQFYL